MTFSEQIQESRSQDSRRKQHYLSGFLDSCCLDSCIYSSNLAMPELFSAILLNHFIGAGRTRESLWLRLEHKTHAQNISHSLMQGLVALKHRVGVDIGLYLKINIIQVKQIAKFVGNIDCLLHLGKLPFL